MARRKHGLSGGERSWGTFQAVEDDALVDLRRWLKRGGGRRLCTADQTCGEGRCDRATDAIALEHVVAAMLGRVGVRGRHVMAGSRRMDVAVGMVGMSRSGVWRVPTHAVCAGRIRRRNRHARRVGRRAKRHGDCSDSLQGNRQSGQPERQHPDKSEHGRSVATRADPRWRWVACLEKCLPHGPGPACPRHWLQSYDSALPDRAAGAGHRLAGCTHSGASALCPVGSFFLEI